MRGAASLTQEGCFQSVWRDGRRHEVSKVKLGIDASEKHLSPEEAPACHRIPGHSTGDCYGFHLKCLTRLMFSAGGGGSHLVALLWKLWSLQKRDLAGGGRKEGSLQLSSP